MKKKNFLFLASIAFSLLLETCFFLKPLLATCIQKDGEECVVGVEFNCCLNRPDICSEYTKVCCTIEEGTAEDDCNNYRLTTPTPNITPSQCHRCYDPWSESCGEINTDPLNCLSPKSMCCNGAPRLTNTCQLQESTSHFYSCEESIQICTSRFGTDVSQQFTCPGNSKCCQDVSFGLNIHGTCLGGDNEISTAIGCIPVGGGFESLMAWILRRAIGISGGIAFLLVISGAFKILTSAGNPKSIQAAQETISSALIGLLLIIFSVFLLELIGVKILGIPGL